MAAIKTSGTLSKPTACRQLLSRQTPHTRLIRSSSESLSQSEDMLRNAFAISFVPSLPPSLPSYLFPSVPSFLPQCLPFVLVRVVYEIGFYDKNGCMVFQSEL